MSQDDVLDLGGRDVLRAADDGVVHPAPHEEEAFLVDIALVAGIEETALVDHPADAGVFGGDLVAADADTSHHTRFEHAVVEVADLEVDTGYDLSDRAEPRPDRLVVARERRSMVVGSENRDGGAGFGETVRVDEPRLGPHLQGTLDDLRRHGSTAVRQTAQARNTLV